MTTGQESSRSAGGSQSLEQRRESSAPFTEYKREASTTLTVTRSKKLKLRPEMRPELKSHLKLKQVPKRAFFFAQNK